MAAACPPGLDGPRRGAVVLPRPGADGARARPLGGLAWPPAALVLPRRLAARPGAARRLRRAEGAAGPLGRGHGGVHRGQGGLRACRRGDRKSTRLNSSHGYISYAVFCLKIHIDRILCGKQKTEAKSTSLLQHSQERTFGWWNFFFLKIPATPNHIILPTQCVLAA